HIQTVLAKSLLGRLARICELDLLFCQTMVDFCCSENPGPQRPMKEAGRFKKDMELMHTFAE
ncbi:MAG: hypothetical protein PHX30_06455, partial [Candidatus Pacebacteria bacterium]|nr:hypothetical protein [Candidatus Paceibacterota bacterium]